MVGQNELLHKIEEMVGNGRFPRTAVFVGQHGIGKRTLMGHVARMLSGDRVLTLEHSNAVSDVRQLISTAYRNVGRFTYVLPDIDRMSLAGVNALLKVIEEPPNDAYFLVSCSSVMDIPETIKSRATQFTMSRYSDAEKLEFLQGLNASVDAHTADMLMLMCDTLSDIRTVVDYGPSEFFQYVDRVLDSISQVSGYAAFKLTDKVSVKESDGKYDTRLFLLAVEFLCWKNVHSGVASDDISQYIKYIKVTSDTACELRVKGANRQMVLDGWTLRMRRR